MSVSTRSQGLVKLEPESVSTDEAPRRTSPRKRNISIKEEEYGDAFSHQRSRKKQRIAPDSSDDFQLPDSEDYRESLNESSSSDLIDDESVAEDSKSENFSSGGNESSGLSSGELDFLLNESEDRQQNAIASMKSDHDSVIPISTDESLFSSSQSSEIAVENYNEVVAKSLAVDRTKEGKRLKWYSIHGIDYIQQWEKVESNIRSGSIAKTLEDLFLFSDYAKDNAQIFSADRMDHSAYLNRIAFGWRVFIQEQGHKLTEDQRVQILDRLTSYAVKPFLDVAVSIWKYSFKPHEKVEQMDLEDLVAMCEQGKIDVPSQIEYLWTVKRLRQENRRFESMILCCAMGEFYKYRYSMKSRAVHLALWENALHQRYVTHLLTLATRPKKEITDSSLKAMEMWQIVSRIASDPHENVKNGLEKTVSKDFVTCFVLYYVICYTSPDYFDILRQKYIKFSRTLKMEFPLNKALDCILNPRLSTFIKLAAGGHLWLQETVLQRLLMMKNSYNDVHGLFQIFGYKELWDVALASLTAASENGDQCDFMVDNVPSLRNLSTTAQYMYIKMIEQRIRATEKLSQHIQRGLQRIGEICRPMQLHLESLGHAYQAFNKMREERVSRENLRVIRNHLFMLKKEGDWKRIINTVIRNCKPEHKKKYQLLKKEAGPEIEPGTNWIDEIFDNSLPEFDISVDSDF